MSDRLKRNARSLWIGTALLTTLILLWGAAFSYAVSYFWTNWGVDLDHVLGVVATTLVLGFAAFGLFTFLAVMTDDWAEHREMLADDIR